MTASSSPTQQRTSLIELAAVFTAMALLVTAQLLASGMTYLVYHPPWLDECLTQLLATDPSFTHAMAAIRGGVETNPPTLYIFLWPLSQLLGGDMVLLRSFGAASTLLAIVGVYAICLQTFGRTQAIIGALALSAHPIVVGQMFEARFYGPWLAAAVWFAYSLMIEPPHGRLRARLIIVRCILAMLLATIHWFGVIVLVMIGMTAAACGVVDQKSLPTKDANRFATPQAAAVLIPVLLGAAASLACFPFFLGQRSGLTVPTWMEPLTLRVTLRIAKHIVFVPMFGALVIFVLWRAIARAALEQRTIAGLRRLLPLLVLLLFPVLITIFSLVVQPALLDRYLIVTIVPLSLLVAALAPPWSDRRARWLIVTAIIGLAVAGGMAFRGQKYFVDIADGRVSNAALVVRDTIDRNGPLPVIFRQRRDQYPLIHIDPVFIDTTAVLDFEGVPDPILAPRTIYERDMARRVNRFYPRYRLATAEQLRHMDQLIVISPAYELEELAAVLRDFQFTPVALDVYHAERKR